MPKEMPDVAKRIRDLEKANKDQKTKIDILETDLTEAASIISGIKKEKNSSDEQERQQLIFLNSRDSRGFLRRNQLANLSLVDNRLIRKTFKMVNSIDYVDTFRRRQKQIDAGKRSRSKSTVGNWNPKTKRWET